MIMTRDDIICIFNSDDMSEGLTPEDFLVHKEFVSSPWISSYEYDETSGLIKLSAYFERSGSNILPLHLNLLGEIPDLLIVDSIHGVFEGCQVENMEYICHHPIDPYVICEIRPRDMIPWNKELPYEAFNVDPDYYGIHDGGRGGRPMPSMHYGQVSMEGISIFGGNDNNGRTTLGDKTGSISVKVMRDGDIFVKQIISLTGRLWRDQDPADSKILDNLKGRIGFGNTPGRVPGSMSWMFYMDDDDEVADADAKSDAVVSFKWGDDISINMQNPRMKAVTYVEDELNFNVENKHPNSEDESESFSYRLYYDGRIVPE